MIQKYYKLYEVTEKWCRRGYPDLWGSLEIYGCKSLQIKCIGNLVVQRTRPNMVGQRKTVLISARKAVQTFVRPGESSVAKV